LLLALVAFTTMQAQDVTKGDITGIVKDPSGMVIPGATVKLASPYGDRSTTTDGGGVYNFQNLVIGPGYTVEVDQPGFAPAIGKGLTVGINQHTAYDFTLQIGTTATTVEVASTSNAIDLSTTTIGANLDETLYKNVPIGRNISAVMAMAPGVADSDGAGAANPSINGASGLENEYIINGANTTDPGFGGFGTYSRVYGPLGNGVDFDFVQEVQVQTGGMEAQYGEALGGVVNVVTKAGTNDFHFDAFEYFQPQQFEATRINANPLLNNKTTYLVHQATLDYGADGGGRILKDKLFWYGGINPLYNTNYKQADPIYANAALGSVPVKTTVYDYTGKIDYNLGTKHQFEGSVFGDPSSTPYTYNQGLSTTKAPGPVDTALETQETYGTRTWTARYNGTFTPNLGVTINYSNYHNNFTDTPLHNGYEITDAVPSQAGTGSNNTYGGIGFNEASVAKVNQVTLASSNVFRLFGQHVLQYGYQFEDNVYDDVYQYSGAPFVLPNIPALGSAAGQTMFGATFTRTHENTKDLSSPIVLKLTRGNYSSPNISTDTRYHAGFIQDSWSFGRITIKPGLRFEQQGMNGIQSHYQFTHNWAPRIGVIIDPFNDRKTKIDMSWGRFFEKIPLDMAVRALTFETSITNAWYADPGAGNQPNLSASAYVPGGPIAFQGDPSALENVAPGTGSQFQDEVTAGAEHEFRNGITFTGRFVYRDLRRIIEDMSGINVTQALNGVPQLYVVGNPSATLDLFQNVTPCTSGPNCNTSTGYTNFANGNEFGVGSDGKPDGFPNPSRIYKSMELIFSKRLPFYNATFYGSYVLSKLDGNFQGSYRSDNFQQDPNISSLFDFTNSDGVLTGQDIPGVLPSDRRHQLKLFGNFQWHSINVGLSFTPTSGTPITDLLDHPAYANAGEIPVCPATAGQPLPNSNNVTPASFSCVGGPRGALGRTAWIFPVNVHLDYTWKVGERLRVKAVADLFNIGNEQAIVRVNQYGEISGAPGTLNPDFLKPALGTFADPYQNPFNARLAVRFEF
jgi:Carboxypeptidase regulatory-like domain/TonB-dependent Receptor Plug Domain